MSTLLRRRASTLGRGGEVNCNFHDFGCASTIIFRHMHSCMGGRHDDGCHVINWPRARYSSAEWMMAGRRTARNRNLLITRINRTKSNRINLGIWYNLHDRLFYHDILSRLDGQFRKNICTKYALMNTITIQIHPKSQFKTNALWKYRFEVFMVFVFR